MKVVVVHNHPIHYKHLLFRELKRQYLDVEVLFAASQSSIRHEETALSEESYRYRIGFDGPYESAPAVKRMQFIWTALSEIRPFIVVISGYHTPEGWAAWCWARLNRRMIVLWYESNEFDYKRIWYKELPKKLFLRHCDRAHVYGGSHKSYLVKLGLRPHQVVLKGSVANVAAFSTKSLERTYSSDGSKHIFFVGRLAPEKNVGFVLRALAAATRQMQTQKLRLSVVGTGPLEQDLKRECEELGIAHLVDFKGYRSQEELPNLLRTADFLILPSTREPWGLVALESMLCRTPVLISTQCGCAEDVVTQETGWKFSPFREAELVSLFLEIPEISAECLAKMGQACHRLASAHSAVSCAERVIASLNELAERSGHTLDRDRVTCAT